MQLTSDRSWAHFNPINSLSFRYSIGNTLVPLLYTYALLLRVFFNRVLHNCAVQRGLMEIFLYTLSEKRLPENAGDWNWWPKRPLLVLCSHVRQKIPASITWSPKIYHWTLIMITFQFGSEIYRHDLSLRLTLGCLVAREIMLKVEKYIIN